MGGYFSSDKEKATSDIQLNGEYTIQSLIDALIIIREIHGDIPVQFDDEMILTVPTLIEYH